jgi:hypothetical protein
MVHLITFEVTCSNDFPLIFKILFPAAVRKIVKSRRGEWIYEGAIKGSSLKTSAPAHVYSSYVPETDNKQTDIPQQDLLVSIGSPSPCV